MLIFLQSRDKDKSRDKDRDREKDKERSKDKDRERDRKREREEDERKDGEIRDKRIKVEGTSDYFILLQWLCPLEVGVL